MIKISFLIAFSIVSVLTGISNDLIDSGSKSTDDEKKVEWVLVWEDNFDYEGYPNEGTGFETWPFDKPQYLILNLAIGGGWGGQKGVDENILPQKYYIDYVRFYQQKLNN